MDTGFYPRIDWLLTIVFIAVIFGTVQGLCAYLVLLERKLSAYMQDRIGPNRVGPFGLLQPLADGIKFVFKEQIVPSHVDRLFYFVGPAVAMTTALLALAVVPFGATTAPPGQGWPETVAQAEEAGPGLEADLAQYNSQAQFVIAPHVDVGFVFVFAVGSLAVYGIILGGWSSNNKYSFLGSLRSSAQIISYEIPLGLSALAAVVLSGSLNLERMIDHQLTAGWHVWYQPLAALLFFTSVLAECNRLPFDLPEAEQELVGGYHTEYSGMKFALFFLGEYTHMVTTSFLVVILFFGGWHLPGLAGAPWPVKLIILVGKMTLVIVASMFIRWTIPRFRFDQLMGLAWKVLIPLALLNLLCLMVVRELALGAWAQIGILIAASAVLLVAAAALGLLRPPRQRVAGLAE